MSAVDQQLFNYVFAIAGALGGWWMKAMWDGLKTLQAVDQQLHAKVSSLEVLVAGKYVRTDALDKMSDAIFAKLDRIEDKLDGKADKP